MPAPLPPKRALAWRRQKQIWLNSSKMKKIRFS
jgi:hypothetical protein